MSTGIRIGGTDGKNGAAIVAALADVAERLTQPVRARPTEQETR